jgi:hypothetical protein
VCVFALAYKEVCCRKVRTRGSACCWVRACFMGELLKVCVVPLPVRAPLQRVKNGLRTLYDDPLIRVQDTLQTLSSTDDASVGLNAMFTFVASLCSILIFFAAWLSFDANVRWGHRKVSGMGVWRRVGGWVGGWVVLGRMWWGGCDVRCAHPGRHLDDGWS